ncbi:LOW QUALITY PROTEIN: hypothetical protein ACSS6W_004193 [Trichoderma asperelloides]
MATQQRWLTAPPSTHTVRVRLIKDVGIMSLPSALLLDPVAEGHEILNGADTAYLIENENLGKKAVFDLGIRKDWWNLPPKVRDPLAFCVGIKVEKDVPEVLQERDIPLDTINDVIHSHLDHRGDVSLFPPNTTLNYGKEMAVMKPEITGTEEAVFLSSDFAGRHNNEIDFSKSTFKIGGFDALDFYDDGSFYLLDTPGHDQGHLSALARTTSSKAGHGKDTFILLVGDACHFCGVLRPNVSHPFPHPYLPSSTIGVSEIENSESLLRRHPRCQQSPLSAAELVKEARVNPWYGVATGQLSTFSDPIVGQRTANTVKEAFDEAENVFVVVCHDLGLLAEENGKPVLPTLNNAPQEDLNNWYENGWKNKLYWTWVSQIGKKDKNGSVQMQEPVITGFWVDGEKFEKAQDVFNRVLKE